MFNNPSASADNEGGARSGVVRRLGQRKSDSGPKVSRLGAKKIADSGQSAKVVRKLGNKSPKSDRSLAPSEAGSEDWSEIGSEEMNSLPPSDPESCTKTTTYKCGPVDKEAVMSRLRAQPKREASDHWVIEENIARDIIPKDEVNPTKLKLDEIAPPPAEPEQRPSAQQEGGQWSLRNSWLANVSRSVASLTAKVTQNVSATAENDLGDFKELIQERLPPEEKIKSGRKYLYEAGINDSFASSQYRQIEVQVHDAPPEKVPKLHEEVVEPLKKQESLNLTAKPRKQEKKKEVKVEPKVEDSWDDWSQDNFEPVEPTPKKTVKALKPENDWGWEDQIQEIPKPAAWDDWEIEKSKEEEDTEMPELEDIPKVQESSSENDWEKDFEPEIEKPEEKEKKIAEQLKENEWENEIFDAVAAAVPDKSEVIVEVKQEIESSTKETGWDDGWEDDPVPAKVLAPIQENLQPIEKESHLEDLPKFNAEEKKKIEDQIKVSLNAEVDKFYDERPATDAWEDDEDWSPPTQNIPVVYHLPSIPEAEPPVYHEVYTESETESDDGSEDEGIQKERKQTKQKSVQECIELLMKNRAELEQRKAELSEEHKEENAETHEEVSNVESAPLPIIENQLQYDFYIQNKSEIIQSPSCGTEIQVEPKKVDTEGWNWNEESLEAETEMEPKMEIQIELPTTESLDDCSTQISKVKEEVIQTPSFGAEIQVEPKKVEAKDWDWNEESPEAETEMEPKMEIQIELPITESLDDCKTKISKVEEEDIQTPSLGAEIQVETKKVEDWDWNEGSECPNVEVQDSKTQIEPPNTSQDDLDVDKIESNVETEVIQTPNWGTEIQVETKKIEVEDWNWNEEPEISKVEILETPELKLAQSLQKSQAISWEDEEEFSSLVANAVHRPAEIPIEIPPQEIERSAWQNDWQGEVDEPAPENRRKSDVKMQEEFMEEGRHEQVVPSFHALPHGYQNTIEVISVDAPTEIQSLPPLKTETSEIESKNDEQLEEGAWSLDPVLKSIESLIIPDSEVLKGNIHYGPQQELPKVESMSIENRLVIEETIGEENSGDNSVGSETDSTSLSSIPSKMSVDLGVHSDLEEREGERQPCEEPVVRKKLAYRCGDDEDENELETAFPPLHAVRLDPIGASREDDLLKLRTIEGQDRKLPTEVFNDPELTPTIDSHDVELKSDERQWDEAEAEPEQYFDDVQPNLPQVPPANDNNWVEALAESEIVPAVQIVHFREPENPVVENLVNEDEDGDGWDDWGEDPPVVESAARAAADGDGWEDPPRPPLVAQSSESAEDGWDDWGDMEGERDDDDVSRDEPEMQEEVHEAPIQAEASPEREHLERQQLENIFSRLENVNQKSNQNWNWKSNFGLSLLANASKNVASFTTSVSQNLSTALETGIPEPEEMARIVKEDERKEEARAEPQTSSTETKVVKKKMALNNLVSGVTQISSKVITGGLDTLEGIGKKTINIIQENDGIISKTKQFVLDLDRKGADPEPEEVQKRPKLPQFETIFDDHHGLVHFEALRLLAKQSQIKLEMLLSPLEGEALEKTQKKVLTVEELCDIPETSDVNEDGEGNHTPGQLEERLSFAVRDLDVEIKFEDVSATWKRTLSFIHKEASKSSSLELYEKALDALAEFTSIALAKFQELANKLSVCKYHSAENEAEALIELVTTCFWHINGMATRFNRQLNKNNDCPDDIKTYTTNIFLEASNANGFIRKSFKFFVPIIQIGAAA